jgi:apolipoprotein N-acyltransferase
MPKNGIGLIFTLLGLSTIKEPGVYPKAYVGYGVLAMIIGVVWISLSIWTILIAAFALAGALIVFGVLFLLYAGTHLPIRRKRLEDR